MATLTLNEARHRYELFDDDELAGFAEFKDLSDYVDFHHTVVYEQFGGRGFASQLIRHALDDMRTHDRKIKATCPFVAGFVQKNPEYQDLLVSPSS